jgi:hypothetical protein
MNENTIKYGPGIYIENRKNFYLRNFQKEWFYCKEIFKT